MTSKTFIIAELPAVVVMNKIFSALAAGLQFGDIPVYRCGRDDSVPRTGDGRGLIVAGSE